VTAIAFDAQQPMRARGEIRDHTAPQHAARKILHGETHVTQRLAQQQIVLEAPAATPAANQLRLNVTWHETHMPAGEGIEILERNRERLSQDHLPQRGHIDTWCAVESDTAQIRWQVVHALPRLGFRARLLRRRL
jgi:hypothetical protein